MSQRSPAASALGAGGLAFEMSKKWWVLLLRGILLIIMGILSFTNIVFLITLIGAYMLIDGIGMLWSGFGEQPAGQSRWPLLLVGLLGIVAGLIVIANPVIGGLSILWVIAAWAIVVGVLEIISAIALRKEIDNEWWLILTGVLSIIFGVLVFQNPIAGAFALQTIFAAFAIVAGIFSIALSFRVRSFGEQIGAVS
ncbi:MAG: DUF308 domain-containing protein [Thermomicrobiales bacterium]|nr:DUF308 domain-containing protein [Thermomicrobiales bacterium]